MGGPGSGNWFHSYGDRKTTVEECCAVAVRDVRGLLPSGGSGKITWDLRDGRKAVVGFSVKAGEGGLFVTLHYDWAEREGLRVPVRMQTTRTQFGGQRWWFTCPLAINGSACNRRVGKLYLPRGQRYFGCRTCYNLTYQSSQEAHQTSRLFGRLGIAYNPRAVRELVRGYRKDAAWLTDHGTIGAWEW